jgi:hypothetical protein
MVREEILEGLKVALAKGESLERAMASFFNAGYTKGDIEEAAAALYNSNFVQQPQQQTRQQAPSQPVSQYLPPPIQPPLQQPIQPVQQPVRSNNSLFLKLFREFQIMINQNVQGQDL